MFALSSLLGAATANVVPSGDKLVAIIETDDVQKFYEVGDLMDNGFTIDSISYEETSVEVSNGSRKYKLILSSFKYENWSIIFRKIY